MDKLVWTKDFSVGVSVLDAQHRRILDMINSLIPSEESPVAPEVLLETLTAVIQYAKQHFEEEERLMRGHGYPDLDVQLSQHKTFLLKAMTFCTAESPYVAGVPEKLQTYLKEWWNLHILEEDMKYKPFFQQQGVR
jgi:hemerythrin-like metal-binding protein